MICLRACDAAVDAGDKKIRTARFRTFVPNLSCL